MDQALHEDVERAEHAQLVADKNAKKSIGGSSAAVITLEAIGETPPFSRSAFGEWLKITGRDPVTTDDDNDRFEMGRLMEEIIARRVERRTGKRLVKVPELVHPQYPWVTGHMDRAEIPDPEDVDWEFKTVDRFDGDGGEWSEGKGEEFQRVPLLYMLQPIWYWGIPRPKPTSCGNGLEVLPAFERNLGLAAQFGFREMRTYHWKPSEVLRTIHARMFEACQFFWEEYVLKDTPPPMPENFTAAKTWLSFKFPNVANGKHVLPGPPSMVDIARAYKEACAKEDEAKKEKEKLRLNLAKMVGGAYGLTASNNGITARVTYPEIPAQTELVTDWKAIIVHELGITPMPEVVKKHTKPQVVKQAYRRMNVTVGDKEGK